MRNPCRNLHEKSGIHAARTKLCLLKRSPFVLCEITHRSMNYLAVNFTVRFTGTGYKEIEPLETSLRSRGMLGSTPVRYLDMQANDGK